MAPLCGCFGPLSHLNWSINYDTMLEKYVVGSAVARFCGRVAKLQLQKHLDFLSEQPYPSDLYYEGDWPDVLAVPGVDQIVYDRCMFDLKVETGPHTGLYIKKPSSVTVSCQELGDPFRNLRCPGRHNHLQGLGHGKEHSDAQLWTWDEASRVVDGITAVCRRHNTGVSKSYPIYYPIDISQIAHASPGGRNTDLTQLCATQI